MAELKKDLLDQLDRKEITNFECIIRPRRGNDKYL